MATTFGDDRDWFLRKRFGLFIHWGLYAIPAWHEQQQWRASVPRATYEALRAQFNPARFDPDAWLDMAERAGHGVPLLYHQASRWLLPVGHDADRL